MSITYKKGEIVWAKIQGYSWWPARITQIKLKLNIKKNRLGKIILQYEKEPIFHITFFPNDSTCKVRLKNLKKFIDKYNDRHREVKRKKLQKAIDIATKTFIKENPNLSMEIKQKIFGLKLFSKNKFHKLKDYLSALEEEEDHNGENDIQSFIESEADEIENYQKELKNKKSKAYIGKKRKLSLKVEIENKKSGNSNTSEEDNDENSYDSRNSCEKKIDNNRQYNKQIKKYSDELFRINIEIKRKNNNNNIINILDDIKNIINNNNFEYDFNIVKDLLIILNSYTHYNNEVIMNKSLLLHKDIVDNFLESIFSYDDIKEISLDNEKEEDDKLNNIFDMCEEIITSLNKMKSNKENSSKNKNRIINENTHNEDIKDLDIIIIKKDDENIENKNVSNIYNYENTNNSEEETKNKENKEKEISDGNNYEEPFLNDVLNTPNYFSKKIEGQLYPDNFFEEIYLKSHINTGTELLRKKMCLQLYNILKLVLPSCQEDTFKKNIIFLEYLARKKDPLLGKKYMAIINMIYNKIKSEAVKIRNKNKN